MGKNNKRTVRIIVVILVAMLLFSVCAYGAGEYSWTDENNIGTVHKAYSSTSWSRYQNKLDYGSGYLDEDIHVTK